MSSDPAKGKIIYRKKNEKEYATYQGKSIRYSDCKGPKKEFEIYLGRPIDKEYLVFYTKEDGLFIFDFEKCKKTKPTYLLSEVFIGNYDSAMSKWNSVKKEFLNINTDNKEKTLTDKTLDLIAEFIHEGEIKDLNFGTTFFYLL